MVDTLSDRLNKVELTGDSDEFLNFDNLVVEVRQLEAENKALKEALEAKNSDICKEVQSVRSALSAANMKLCNIASDLL